MSECFFCGRANTDECDDMCPNRRRPNDPPRWEDTNPDPLTVPETSRQGSSGADIAASACGLTAGDAQRKSEWRDIVKAPLDGTPVLVRLKNPIPNTREDLRNWDGIIFVGRYHGDLTGWSFAAPVGQGGFPSGWMDGWAPIPAESSAVSPSEARAGNFPPDDLPETSRQVDGGGE